MKTYNCNNYMYIIKGSEKQISIGVEYTKNIPMGKFKFCDNLMFQIGSAIESEDKQLINNLYGYCLSLSKEINGM